VLRVFEQGGIFIVSYLLLHETYVYMVSSERLAPSVPQWDSNHRRKDHEIFAPDALTTALRGLFDLEVQSVLVGSIDLSHIYYHSHRFDWGFQLRHFLPLTSAFF
jgi:hypothetical protein